MTKADADAAASAKEGSGRRTAAEADAIMRRRSARARDDDEETTEDDDEHDDDEAATRLNPTVVVAELKGERGDMVVSLLLEIYSSCPGGRWGVCTFLI